MEDFRVDIILGEGMNARTISLNLKRFTLIGATTRSGMLSSPMRDRFKMQEHLEFYSVEELAQIVRVNAGKLHTPISDEAALELAQRCRGTPRIANARLWWVRNYSPPAKPMVRSRSKSPGRRSKCKRWIARDSISRTAAISKR